MFELHSTIPGITSLKDFEIFLESTHKIGFVLELHLNFIEHMIQRAHQKNKKLIVHIELVKGISADEYGCEYLCQKLKVDGIISTKGKVIESAKKNNVITIQRIFLMDSNALQKSLVLTKKIKPDYLEILPAIASSIVSSIHQELDIEIIGGGLLQSNEELEECFKNGMIAISTSNQKFW